MNRFLSLLADTAIDPFSLQEPPQETIPETHFLGEFLYMLLMLAILVTVVYLTSWFLKKMVNTRVEHMNATSSIKVLEKRGLSAKTTLFLIESEGTDYLIAETPTTVVLLNKEKTSYNPKSNA